YTASDFPALHSFPTRRSSDLALFGWSLYEPSKAPPVEYLRKRNLSQYLGLSRDKEVPENEAAWNALLDEYHFTNMDDQGIPRRRSEEHTSELQSRSDLVCRLL